MQELRPLYRNFFESVASVQLHHRALALTTVGSTTALWLWLQRRPLPRQLTLTLTLTPALALTLTLTLALTLALTLTLTRRVRWARRVPRAPRRRLPCARPSGGMPG